MPKRYEQLWCIYQFALFQIVAVNWVWVYLPAKVIADIEAPRKMFLHAAMDGMYCTALLHLTWLDRTTQYI